MKHFMITYHFKGAGNVVVNAENQKEATRNFYKGKGWGPETEYAQNYKISEVKKITNKL